MVIDIIKIKLPKHQFGLEDTMIKSMTGFGRSEISEGKRKISVEMKSVNHRYLEAGIKMPKKLNIIEARISD